jgi:hypothetical protein
MQQYYHAAERRGMYPAKESNVTQYSQMVNTVVASTENEFIDTLKKKSHLKKQTELFLHFWPKKEQSVQNLSIMRKSQKMIYHSKNQHCSEINNRKTFFHFTSQCVQDDTSGGQYLP